MREVDLRLLIAPSARISSKNRPIMLNCLWHEDKHASLAIYSDHLYCFGCNKHLSTLEWVAEGDGLDIKRDFRKVLEAATKYGTAPPIQRYRWVEKKAISSLSADIAHHYHSKLGTKRSWFLNRGLTDETIDSQLLGYDGRAFTIPVWHPSGKLLTIRFRRDDALITSGPKYWGIPGRNDTLLYNQVALRQCTVVITEGELDCILLWQEGIPAVSSTNGVHGMIQIWDEVKSQFLCSRIIIVFDQDAEGRSAAAILRKLICKRLGKRLDKSLPSNRAVILRWDKRLGKDITELVKKKGIGYIKNLLGKELECLKTL